MKTIHFNKLLQNSRSSFMMVMCVFLSFYSEAQLPWNEDFGSYVSPSGVQGVGVNNVGDYPATPWVLDASGASLTATSDYGYVTGGQFVVQDSDGDFVWTSENIDISSCSNVDFTLDLSEIGTMEATDYIHVEYSTNGGGSYTSINNWLGLGDATHTVIDDFTSTTVTQTGLTGTTFVLKVTFNCNAGTEQLILDNISITGTCSGGVTITTGAVSGAPFIVDCSVPTTDAGTVSFSTVGTFNAGNIFTAQLSDETGSFASPTNIGTLALSGTDVSDVINITIPATALTGSGYLIRVVSDDPVGIGSNSAVFQINQLAYCGPSVPSSPGLIINEWSNGPSGNQEYYEFVVAGQCGESVDIQGYILDDNNATFTNPADYDATASGIAPGHFRFAYNAQWANIPVGSLIVVYNSAEPNGDLPADDPTDANNDSLYVVPHDSPLFERCTTLPASTSPDSIYTPCTYAQAPLNGWNPLSLRNSGDAIQVRNPDGSYYHGVSYGGSEMTGGPHNLKLFTGSGSGMSGWFSDDDFFDVANWSSGTVAGNQTPGQPNNLLNENWLKLMRDTTAASCPITILPVQIAGFSGATIKEGNLLEWNTVSELNSDYFVLERSVDGKHWIEIGTLNAAGNSDDILHYKLLDPDYQPVVNYYRLRQIDNDGTEKRHYKIVTLDNRETEKAALIGIYNLLGQPVDADYRGVQIHLYEDGTSERIYKQ